jgi:hypothetical protein
LTTTAHLLKPERPAADASEVEVVVDNERVDANTRCAGMKEREKTQHGNKTRSKPCL